MATNAIPAVSRFVFDESRNSLIKAGIALASPIFPQRFRGSTFTAPSRSRQAKSSRRPRACIAQIATGFRRMFPNAPPLILQGCQQTIQVTRPRDTTPQTASLRTSMMGSLKSAINASGPSRRRSSPPPPARVRGPVLVAAGADQRIQRLRVANCAKGLCGLFAGGIVRIFEESSKSSSACAITHPHYSIIGVTLTAMGIGTLAPYHQGLRPAAPPH